MTLEELGNLGDFLGGMAVIGTLLYLAFQIRKQSQETRLTATRELAADFSRTMDAMSSDPDLLRIYLTGIRDFMSLPDEDRLRLSFIFIRNFRAVEQQYLHIDLGNIDPVYFASLNIAFLEFLSFPGVQTWWEMSNGLFESGFRERIERDFKAAKRLNYKGSYQTTQVST